MAYEFVICPDCGKEINSMHESCPICNAKKITTRAKYVKIIAFFAAVGMLYKCQTFGSSPDLPSEQDSSTNIAILQPSEAQTICKVVIKEFLKDPERTEIPYVRVIGSGPEFLFHWGRETKFIRGRNGLGMDVPISATCIVDQRLGEITQLSINNVKYK